MTRDQPTALHRAVRAMFDDETITVYQAFPAEIAIPAAASNTFMGTPFKLGRMTWIKPSFLWMMYRSGWATKPGQERILKIRMLREGFHRALRQSCLTSYEPGRFRDRDEWNTLIRREPVRVQWDPERDIYSRPLSWRTLQLGLSGAAIAAYVDEWVASIDDITPSVEKLRFDLSHGLLTSAEANLPDETLYPLPVDIARRIGAGSVIADVDRAGTGY